MLIDWFTVGAQALNFLILAWLMQRFLYRPILLAIDTREQRIAAERADAERIKADAQQEHDRFSKKNAEFDQQRTTMLDQARDAAKGEGQRLLDEARKAADTMTAKRQDLLAASAQDLNQAISLRTRQAVFAITRQVLTDLATTNLEERLGEVFIRRVQDLDAATKEAFAKALAATAEQAIIRSAFPLPEEQRTAIQHALNTAFAADIHLRYETTPDLLGGVELTTTNGQQMGWNIAGYLTSLEKGVDDLLHHVPSASPA